MYGIFSTEVKNITKKEYIHWEIKIHYYYPKGSKRHGETEARLCHKTLCTAYTLVTVTRLRLVYHIFNEWHFEWNRKLISATITLSSCGVEVRGISLVPFYCCLGIKSGSGAYSDSLQSLEVCGKLRTAILLLLQLPPECTQLLLSLHLDIVCHHHCCLQVRLEPTPLLFFILKTQT